MGIVKGGARTRHKPEHKELTIARDGGPGGGGFKGASGFPVPLCLFVYFWDVSFSVGSCLLDR